MNKKDLDKLENAIREIIETLKEELPEGETSVSYAKDYHSTFRQLIETLEMELASLRIMYSDETNIPAAQIDESFSRYLKIAVTGGSVILLLIIVLLFLRHQPHDTQAAKAPIGFPDGEKERHRPDNFKGQVLPQQKNTARKVYQLGKADLDKKNLRSALEHFRIAVSIDPSNTEYMNAYRQLDNKMRKKIPPHQTR